MDHLESIEWTQDKHGKIVDGTRRDECGTHLEKIAHVLDKRYGANHEVLPGLGDSNNREYRVGHLHIYLSCQTNGPINGDADKNGATKVGFYEKLSIVYVEERLEKQRDLELDQLKTQELDRKTRDIDSSKF